MLAAFCAYMDDCRMRSYLETDKAENVRFYRKVQIHRDRGGRGAKGAQLVHVPATARKKIGLPESLKVRLDAHIR
jgi:hypothetical protein